MPTLAELLQSNLGGVGSGFAPRGSATVAPGPQQEIVGRGAMLPIGYHNDGSMELAWPSMVTEPLAAGKRLFVDGGWARGPNDPVAAQDMSTLLMSGFGGNTVGGLTRGAGAKIAAEALSDTGKPGIGAVLAGAEHTQPRSRMTLEQIDNELFKEPGDVVNVKTGEPLPYPVPQPNDLGNNPLRGDVPLTNDYDKAILTQVWKDKIRKTGELFSDTGKPSLLGAALAGAEHSPLPMDQASRLARANEIYRPETVFHGTGAMDDFGAFDLSKGGSQSGSRAGGLGISVAPDAELANEFAFSAANRAGGDPRVLPLRYRSENRGVITLPEGAKNLEVAATLEDAWKNGYDSVVLRNYSSPNGMKNQTVIVVKDPNQLRSVNAAFDPTRINDPGLLLSDTKPSILGAALLGYDPNPNRLY